MWIQSHAALLFHVVKSAALFQRTPRDTLLIATMIGEIVAESSQRALNV
jgi:hypothetical protein